jgi:hypothetical protein
MTESTAAVSNRCSNCGTEYQGGPRIVTTLVYRGHTYGPYCERCMREGVSVVTHTYVSGKLLEAAP